jgi:peptidoglycan/xylan/chitin deacetylase (PgdA/CDA1 family)
LNNKQVVLYDELLAILDEHGIKATFAFVGSLGLNMQEFECLANNAPGQNYMSRLHLLRKRSIKEQKLWYDSELIDKVVCSKQNHEIASHSFSHIRFTDEVLNQDAAKYELERSYEILKKKTTNNQLKTFIFPGNCINHLNVFKESKFQLYRGSTESWFNKLPLTRLVHFIDQALPIAPPSVKLGKDIYGNYFLPGSLVLFCYDGIRKIIPDSIRFIKIKRGIDRAIREKKVFHLWFHPWNMGSSKRMKSLLYRVLKYVETRCSEGVLRVETMSDVFDRKIVSTSDEQ